MGEIPNTDMVILFSLRLCYDFFYFSDCHPFFHCSDLIIHFPDLMISPYSAIFIVIFQNCRIINFGLELNIL